MADKWYSNGLLEKDAERIGATFGKIKQPVYGITDRNQLALQFGLNLANGTGTNWQLSDSKDIKELLKRTKAYEVSELEGKVVEAYVEGGPVSGILRGISVNEMLI